jgi:hypothetical protein
MEFDRQLLRKIGGEFTVHKSQAKHGIKPCKIAIRKPGTRQMIWFLPLNTYTGLSFVPFPTRTYKFGKEM